jgi:hypothetical protein
LEILKGKKTFLRLIARCVRSIVLRLAKMSSTPPQQPNTFKTDLKIILFASDEKNNKYFKN